MSSNYGVRVNWTTFKQWIDSGVPFKEIILNGSLRLIATDGNSKINCIIHTDGDMPTEYSDYQTNYASLKNGINKETDSSGRSIIRPAATKKGWHYQAHSIQFEINKLNSIYNKDHDGNDLGYCSLKIYDAQGNELTDQNDVDTQGVKTIITWSPDFNFEIISGNVRQITKETVDTYLYVNAEVATGLAAPNDWLTIPFVQGGINLNYIGSDEPLKTDGRAGKLILANTNNDYFQIICNYDADLLTNENRHKMSIIFEIYKDPMS